MSESAKLVIEVYGGVIPGEPMSEFTRQWAFTSEQLSADDHEVLDGQGAALNYAASLQNPSVVNWVRLDWVWL